MIKVGKYLLVSLHLLPAPLMAAVLAVKFPAHAFSKNHNCRKNAEQVIGKIFTSVHTVGYGTFTFTATSPLLTVTSSVTCTDSVKLNGSFSTPLRFH